MLLLLSSWSGPEKSIFAGPFWYPMDPSLAVFQVLTLQALCPPAVWQRYVATQWFVRSLCLCGYKHIHSYDGFCHRYYQWVRMSIDSFGPSYHLQLVVMDLQNWPMIEVGCLGCDGLEPPC